MDSIVNSRDPMKTYRSHKIAQRGFTVIELLVIVATIALLACVLIPCLTKAN